MNMQHLIAQVLANAPDCPAYEINGYLLELIEKVRLQGSREMISVSTSAWETAGRYSIPVPTQVITVHHVYVNGIETAQTLSESEVVDIDEDLDDLNLWADPYDDKTIADYDGKLIGLVI
jgi:hypothetical protein